MSIFSEDVGFLFLYILPGFLAFEVMMETVGSEKKLKEFQTVMFSFIFSSLIYLPWAWLTKVDNINDFKTSLYSLQNMIGLIIAGWAMGYLVALAYNQIFEPNRLLKPVWVTAFNEVFEDRSLNMIVLTENGNEFSSIDVYYTKGTELKKRELILLDAVLIKRNDDFEITQEKKLNSDIYLDSKVIKRIIFPLSENEDAPDE